MKKIYSDSIIDNSSGQIGNRFNRNHNLIYLSVLVAMIAAIASMFVIEIDIVVTASGIIKPEGERNTITAPANGRLSMVKLEENSYVRKGDTLFVISPDNITVQLPSLNQRRTELSNFIFDIGRLASDPSNRRVELRSSVYTKEHVSYLDQLNDYEYNTAVAEKNFEREQKLYQAGVISGTDFDVWKEKYESAKKALAIFKSKTSAQWQAQKSQYEKELREVESLIGQLQVQTDESVICSPVSGTIQKLENVADGMYVHSGQKIVEISPDGKLVVECHIAPKDIGLIRENQRCNIQVDAYNYNQWGMLTGYVDEIFKDILYSNVSDQQYAYFPVYCELDSDRLSLNNGYESTVRKGMTITCRMVVTRRTITQLLYDKVDDWLNPNLMN